MIKAGWLKWRSVSEILSDRKIPFKLKGKVYKMVIKPRILYGFAYLVIKEQHILKKSMAKMRILRWMTSNTLSNRIRN